MSASPDACHVQLELEPDGDTIRGVLQRPDGTRQRFWGWLELMAALERATGVTQQDGAQT